MSMSRLQRLLRSSGGLVLSLVVAFTALTPLLPATALSGSNFNPGHIIDDAVFTSTGTMSANDIQNFLNAKVPTCDVTGANNKSYYYNSSTGELNLSSGSWVTTSRAIYGQRYADFWNNHTVDSAGNKRSSTYIPNESVGPYVCMKDYVENPATLSNNLHNPGLTVSGGQSAAQIIYSAAQNYGINPEVLLTTLQKEQGGITDDWPWMNEYEIAMGYACPDSGSCSSTYYGFANQVNSAAKQFRRYLTSPNNYNYVPGTNTIKYNPTASCGSGPVNIQNEATAALYNYTPYQPNAPALANVSDSSSGGSGNTCSAYGNRNFWWYFNTWFGPSILSNLPGCTQATNTTRTCIWRLENPANSAQVLTSSVQLRDQLYLNEGYQYEGMEFFGNAVQLPGNVPVYRLTDALGASFLTTSTSEYNSLVSAGYTGNGIDFWADPAGSNTGYPIYRLRSTTTGKHYWTGNPQERQTLLNTGYQDEGVAFTSISSVRQEIAPPTGKMLVYRFYIPQTHSHFWTTDVYERDTMINAGYSYEGGAWYSSASSSATPVYRLYAPSIQQHLWTTDANEKNTLVASGGWSYEGISQYVTTTPNSQPVYRLYAPSLGVHFLTADLNEKNSLAASGGWNYEGVAWYQSQ